jgi:hypothetical protein
MNLLKRLLGKIRTKPTNEVGYKEVKVIGIIYASVVTHHGWDDPVEMLNNTSETALILDLASVESEVESMMSYWNKIYYNNLTAHYQINNSRLESISEILNVPKEKHTNLYHNWPAVISEKQYNQMFRTLNLKFVQYKPLEKKYEGKYVIKLNESFWDVKVARDILLIDIINTYERSFKDFELIHETYEQAMYYGIIIMDKLCNQRAPDNYSTYQHKIKEQSKQFKGLPVFCFNSLKYEEEDVKAEYGRIFKTMKPELKLMKKVLEVIPNKPFEVIKIKSEN